MLEVTCLYAFHCFLSYLIILCKSVDLATSCYEYACGKFPNNLELMMGLFNCYVREYSFVKQQQVIYHNVEHLFMHCYGTKLLELYLFWSCLLADSYQNV